MFGSALAVPADMVERRQTTDRRALLGGGRRNMDVQANNGNGCSQAAQQAARLCALVESLAPAMQLHAEAVRCLVDAVQALTAERHKR